MPAEIPGFSGTYRDITAALAEAIRRERTAGFLNPEEPAEILIPSRGVADGLVAALLRDFPQGIAGIRLQTPDALALRILNRAGKFPRVAAPADRRLLMHAAAAQLKGPLLNTAGISAALERSYRDVRDSGVTLQAFRKAREQFPDRERAGEILDAWRRYEAALQRSVAIDPADAFHQAIEALSSVPDLPAQIVFGFYDMTGIQEMFLQALHRAGKIDSIYVPANLESPAYRFAMRHIIELKEIAPNLLAAPGTGHPARTWTARKFATPADEARETCRSVRRLIDSGEDPRRIGLVARRLEPEFIALLRRAAADFDFSLSLPSSRRLISHPFGRILHLLLKIREERFPRSMVIELCGAPFRRDFWPVPVNVQRLDLATRRAEIAGGSTEWVKGSLRRIEADAAHELEHITTYIRALQHLEQLTEPLATKRRAVRWAETIETLSEAFDVQNQDDLTALDAVRDLAAVCRRADSSGALAGPEAILHLLDTADDLSLSPTPQLSSCRVVELSSGLDAHDNSTNRQADHPGKALGASVWVGDVMKARGRAFDHLFILDLRDGAFPQPRNEDPLISNTVRRAAGVREILDGREEERLLFQLLIDATGQSLHFSYPAADGIRRVYYASQFLKDFAQENETDPALRQLALRDFSGYLQAKNPPDSGPRSRTEKKIAAMPSIGSLSPSLARRIDLVRLAGTRSQFDSYLALGETFEKVLQKKLALISPTHLEFFGQCPQRFLFTSILGIGEIEDPEHELQISIRKKGGLDHSILEIFYRTLTNADLQAVAASSGALPKPLLHRLDSVIDEEFRRHDSEYPAPNQMIRQVERKLTRKFLTQFVSDDLRDLAATGFRPEHFEYQFGPGRGDSTPDHDAVTLRLGAHEVTLKGKMDRVDHHAGDGIYRVIDYKSGKGIKFKKLADLTRSGRALQLGFYALAACQIFGVPPEKMVAAIKPLRPGLNEETLRLSLAEVFEELTATLARLGDSMTAGHFPAFPGAWCDYCAVGSWCRATHDPREKHLLNQYDSVAEMLGAVAGSELRVAGSEVPSGSTSNPQPPTRHPQQDEE